MQLWYRRPVSPAAAAAEPASENLRSQSTTRQTKSAEMELDLWLTKVDIIAVESNLDHLIDRQPEPQSHQMDFDATRVRCHAG